LDKEAGTVRLEVVIPPYGIADVVLAGSKVGTVGSGNYSFEYNVDVFY